MEIKFEVYGHLADEDYRIFKSTEVILKPYHCGIMMPYHNPTEEPICDHAFRQYTGFHHKDKPVFDGDIFKTYHFKAAGGAKRYLYHAVVWREDLGQWYLLNLGSLDFNDGSCPLWMQIKNHPEDSAVIGNKYENPDPLEK